MSEEATGRKFLIWPASMGSSAQVEADEFRELCRGYRQELGQSDEVMMRWGGQGRW